MRLKLIQSGWHKKLIGSIKFNLKHRLDDTIEQLVASDLEDYLEYYNLLDELELYDNYDSLLNAITNNIVAWCAENNELFYNTIIKYTNFLEDCDEQSLFLCSLLSGQIFRFRLVGRRILNFKS